MSQVFRYALCLQIILAIIFPGTGIAQSTYDLHALFNPQFFTTNGNEWRSAGGAPGPKYWQNKADYLIHTTLDETAPDTSIKGDVTLSYTNNSPDRLDFIWFQLDQNLFDSTSRGAATTPTSGDRFDVKGFSRGGYHIESVEVTYLGQSYPVKPVITDARMQVRLKTPLKPGGDKISIKIKYHFAIPLYGADRMGRLRTSNGVIYEIAQWYPRVCVYDDVEGWNTLAYMGLGEFYCDYGNFDYYITAPAAMTVVASGDLQNPVEVLTPKEINRLDKARNSDSTVMIVDVPEINQPSSRPKSQGSLTWHYKMTNSRDVSWAASTAFIWDAARVNFPSGRKGISMSAYPVESAGNDRYGRSTQYLKRSIELYSTEYFEYPWNSAVSVAGVALGMEYPGIVFCQSGLENGNLFNDITHEIGHNWFPMIVGSNERRFMWMDEGLNTFINRYTTEKFNNGEYVKDNMTPEFMYQIFRNEKFSLMTAPEGMDLNGYGSYYFKTAAGLELLRKVVLDPDRFDYAFNTYISRWAFKHPQPDDFFRTMNNAAGEKLDWFWREWFYTTWTLDQSVKDVKYVKGDPAKGCLITLENLSQMALPVIVQVNEANGQSRVVRLPVDIWQRQGTWTFKFNSTDSITSVVLDPDHVLPDINRSNNVWKGQETPSNQQPQKEKEN
jgi:hypothetical protein